MDIKLIVIGKIKEDYLNEAILEYTKRIKPMANLKIIEIKEINNHEDLKNLDLEAEMVLKEIKLNDYIVTLEIEGNELTSVELSEFIRNHYTYNNKVLTFIIGSSNGLSKKIKDISNYKLSFSKLTFPHQLFRVNLLEQIYRAYKINNNEAYHK